MPKEQQETCFSWVVCAASFYFQTMQGGHLFSMGILYILFRDALDASDSAIAFISSLHLGIFCICGVLAGYLTDKFGERRTCLFASGLASLGLILSSQVNQAAHLYVTYSLINGTGLGIIYLCSLSILDKYFHQHKSLGSGIATCGIGIGSFVFPPLIKQLADFYGWRGVFLLMAGINMHGFIMASFLRPVLPVEEELQVDDCANTGDALVNHTDQVKKTSDVTNDIQRSLTIKNYISLFCNMSFMGVVIYQILQFLVISSMYIHLGAYLLSLGFSRDDSVMIYTVLGVANTVGRLVSGLIAQAPHINVFAVAMLGSLLNGAITLLLPLTTNLVLISIYAGFFSLCIAPFGSLALPMISSSVTKVQVPAALGLAQLLLAPGVVCGGPLAATIYEATNVYAFVFFIAGALFVLSGLALVFSWWKYRQMESAKTNLQYHLTSVMEHTTRSPDTAK